MTKSLVKWLLLPIAGILMAMDAGSLLEALEFGDPYTWLVNTGWTTWLGVGLLVLGLLLLLLFRVRPEYGVWFTYIPFVKMWKEMHANHRRTGVVQYRGVGWAVTMDGRLLDCDAEVTVEPRAPVSHVTDQDSRRVRKLVLRGHALYLRELLLRRRRQ